MQSHEDSSHKNPAWFEHLIDTEKKDRMRALEEKAQRMVDAGQSAITAGKPGEIPLGEAYHNGVLVRRMPDDEHGVLRLSIGECPGVDKSAYCVIRGDRLACAELLRKAARALERSEF